MTEISGFAGFARPDGRYGTRNHVLVISVMDNMNPVVRAACRIVDGVVPITPEFGRGHVGEDQALRRRNLSGLCTQPNVAGVVLVSLEPKEAQGLAEAAERAGKLVEVVVMGRCAGTLDAVHQTAFAAARMRRQTSVLQRTLSPASALVLGMECGGSDGTSGIVTNPVLGLVADALVDAGGTVIFTETTEIIGADALLSQRSATPEVASQIAQAIQRTEAIAMANGGFIGANPVPDNVAGGLSTIEEKAIGAVAKAGARPIVEYVDSGQLPSESGVVYMDSTPPAMESMTALSASGANVILFSTGGGNPSGNPVSPTLKICANQGTVDRMRDAIDVDLVAALRGDISFEEAAERVIEAVLVTASGGQTWSEVTGYTDIAISRLGASL